jgi:hypothetical protein
VVDGSVEVDPCSPGVINSAGTTDALSGRRAINAYGVGTAQQTAARGDSTAAPGGDTAAAPNSTDVGAYVASEPMQSGVGPTQRKTAVQLPLIQMGRTYPKKNRCPAYWHITASKRKERSVASKSAPLLQRAEACKCAPLLQALARGLGDAVGMVVVFLLPQTG